MAKEITPRGQDYAQWYQDLVIRAGLADYSAVRGCMVIKPYGFAIWERMRDALDAKFKATGHQNAYFPLFIPKSFFSKEAAHVDGFAKECAVVTHYRLRNGADGQIEVDPQAKLEEELIVRPTSETIIWNSYRDWIQSYRDLPLLINQWANVVRWEMRTRLFLRTTEFLWQEGHTAHANAEEAIHETKQMLEVYAEFAEQWMAMPVIKGVKTEQERFAGAVDTYCIEALMQDGKALQAGTSHFLGQNFAKAFDVQFANAQGGREYVWATSWGVSTRLMGALIMAHSDDQGLVLPPMLAPVQAVVVPIYKGPETIPILRDACQHIVNECRAAGLRVELDAEDNARPGWKFAHHEMRGVPVRIAMGTRDLENGTVELARRDLQSKTTIAMDGVGAHCQQLMNDIQDSLFKKALDYRQSMTFVVDTWEDFQNRIEEGGLIAAHWDGTNETETAIKEATKATIRCIPLDQNPQQGQCVYSGKHSQGRVLFAKAY
jgi:prolyl-tRNA synthetase